MSCSERHNCMNRAVVTLLKEGRVFFCLGITLLFAGGCSNIQADGFHTVLPSPRTKTVVWGEYPGAVNVAMIWLQQKGLSLIERAKLDHVLKEQAIQLTHTADDQAQLLKVGKLVGANLLVFVEVTGASATKADYVGIYGGIGSVRTVYQVRASVRAVDLETAEVLWVGSAHYNEPIENLEEGVSNLIRLALERAWCDKDRWHFESCQRSNK